MNLFTYGGRHFEMMSVPAKNIIIFSDDKKLEDYDGFGDQAGGDYHEIVPSTIRDGYYDLIDNKIELHESIYLLNTGALISTQREVSGNTITWSGVNPNTRNTQGTAVFVQMDFDLYTYDNRLFIRVDIELDEVVLDSVTQQDQVGAPVGKPNMLDALAESGNPEFTYYFFISEDGFKIEQAYSNTVPSGNKDIVFYMETSGGSNAFGSVMRLRSGEQVNRIGDFALPAVRKVLGYHNTDSARLSRDVVQEHLDDKREKKEEGATKIVLTGISEAISLVAQARNFPLWLLEESFTFLSEDVLLKHVIAGEDRWRYYNTDDSLNSSYAGMFPSSFIEAVGDLSGDKMQLVKNWLGDGLDTAFAKAQQELAPYKRNPATTFFATFISNTFKKLEQLYAAMVFLPHS